MATGVSDRKLMVNIFQDKDEYFEILSIVFESTGDKTEAEIVGKYKSGLYPIKGDSYKIVFFIPTNKYEAFLPDKKKIEEKIKDMISAWSTDDDPEVSIVKLARKQDFTFKYGERITNQGRVRSDNIAPLKCDGLLFRSYPEINFYKALKRNGILFSPLPAYILGGEYYKRCEPDFVIIKDGKSIIIEVDGEEFHKGTKQYDIEKSLMFEREGLYTIRISASDCNTEESADRKVLELFF